MNNTTKKVGTSGNLPMVRLTNSSQIANHLNKHWNSGVNNFESFYVLSLTSDNELIACDCIGTRDEKRVFIGKNAPAAIGLKRGADKIIIAHNHPSGNPSPSDPDIMTTKLHHFRCQCVDIDLSDHVIICPGKSYFSFAEKGLMQRIRNENQTAFNVIDPNSFENKVLTVVETSFKERQKGIYEDCINNKLNKTLDKLFIKYFDPIEIKEMPGGIEALRGQGDQIVRKIPVYSF